ncbi:hypothetical protein PHLCEN_2v9641 [Hermanssonia centrifuga]|uniref:Uncharacterized protein n=1 Tax=Hermanssonia centrifuga TaxID=98765 RepID=A0A2R6NQ97_9APHY|nr:hypothetical protein PHLCEN_2v9641 [Hermanssonia centrifuga]
MHVRQTWDAYHEGAGWVGMTVAGGIDSEGEITPITYCIGEDSERRTFKDFLLNRIGWNDAHWDLAVMTYFQGIFNRKLVVIAGLPVLTFCVAETQRDVCHEDVAGAVPTSEETPSDASASETEPYNDELDLVSLQFVIADVLHAAAKRDGSASSNTPSVVPTTKPTVEAHAELALAQELPPVEARSSPPCDPSRSLMPEPPLDSLSSIDSPPIVLEPFEPWTRSSSVEARPSPPCDLSGMTTSVIPLNSPSQELLSVEARSSPPCDLSVNSMPAPRLDSPSNELPPVPLALTESLSLDDPLPGIHDVEVNMCLLVESEGQDMITPKCNEGSLLPLGSNKTGKSQQARRMGRKAESRGTTREVASPGTAKSGDDTSAIGMSRSGRVRKPSAKTMDNPDYKSATVKRVRQATGYVKLLLTAA